MLRTFIAIELPEEIRRYIQALTGELRKHLTNTAVRWVKVDNIHLTLRFLGETEEELLPQLFEIMDSSISDFNPFQLTLGNLGCFPNPQRPRVIWIDVAGSIEQVLLIQNNLERSIVRLGWKPEGRRFHPHLTLGRVKESANVAAAKLPWGKAVSSRSMMVSEIYLFESILRPTGAVYNRRHTSKLS